MRTHLYCLAMAAVVCCISMGCFGGDERPLPSRLSVSGSVTLDGEPLKEATISFVSEADMAHGLPVATSIINGKYEFKVTPGKKMVKVSQFVIDAIVPELIPAKYNQNSTLEANVTPENNTFDFKLTSK